MQEIIAGLVTVLDVIALYLLLPTVNQRFLLAIWTGLLHMLFPIFGFEIGGWAMTLLMQWGDWLSGILLFLIGLHILFASNNNDIPKMHPAILALTASVDTFSVSISFGMLNLNKYLFIFTAGIGAFVLSYISLTMARKMLFSRGNSINIISGMAFIALSIATVLK